MCVGAGASPLLPSRDAKPSGRETASFLDSGRQRPQGRPASARRDGCDGVTARQSRPDPPAAGPRAGQPEAERTDGGRPGVESERPKLRGPRRGPPQGCEIYPRGLEQVPTIESEESRSIVQRKEEKRTIGNTPSAAQGRPSGERMSQSPSCGSPSERDWPAGRASPPLVHSTQPGPSKEEEKDQKPEKLL